MPELDLGKLSDRDLLVLTAQEIGHVKAHLATLNSSVAKQGGRLASAEMAIEVLLDRDKQGGIPKRVTALEKWRWSMSGVIAVVVAGWPLLIYEVRQFLLEKFSFIP